MSQPCQGASVANGLRSCALPGAAHGLPRPQLSTVPLLMGGGRTHTDCLLLTACYS